MQTTGISSHAHPSKTPSIPFGMTAYNSLGNILALAEEIGQAIPEGKSSAHWTYSPHGEICLTPTESGYTLTQTKDGEVRGIYKITEEQIEAWHKERGEFLVQRFVYINALLRAAKNLGLTFT